MGGDAIATVAAVLVLTLVGGFNLNQIHTEPKLKNLEQKVETLTEENEQLKAEKQRTQAQLEGALMIRR